jgi:RND superfamily putative drug exporter
MARNASDQGREMPADPTETLQRAESSVASPMTPLGQGATPAEKSDVMVRLSRFVLRRRRWVVAFWVVVTLVGMASAGRVTKALSDTYDVPGHPGYEANQLIAKTYNSGGNNPPIVAVVTVPPGSDVDSPSVKSGFSDVVQRIAAAAPEARVASYFSTGNRAFVSHDGRTTFVVIYPPPEPGTYGQSPKALTAITAAVAGQQVDGSAVHVTGIEALNSSSGQKGGLSLLAESLVGGLGALLVLAFVFASVLALVPLMIAVASIMASFLLVWALTAATQVNSLVEFLIALVGLGVAIDYSLLIIARWREERAHGHEGEDAIVRAMSTAGRAVIFSGTTVAIGLLALVALPLPFIRSVGLGGMLIPLVSVAAALTLLPVILFKLGGRLDWPHIRSEDRPSRFWTRWAAFVVRHRGLVAGVAAAILVMLALAATSIHLGSAQGEPDALAERGSAHQGLVALERSGINGGALMPIEVVTTERYATRIVDAVSNMNGVHGASAPSGPSWARDGRRIVDVFPTSDVSSTVDRVAAAVHRVAPSAGVGGVTAQNDDFIAAAYRSFPLMLAIIAVLTILLLALALRSLVLPVKAVVVNLLSISAALGVLVLVWQKGYGSHALWGVPATQAVLSWLPLIVFAFLFGLSMDYEVFILSRMREEYDKSGSTATAVERGIGRTGRLVTSAALVMFLGFVAMASAPNSAVKMMATGLGAGILLDAVIIRALFVPAVVALFGQWNWWLPQPLARLLRVQTSDLAVQ